MLRRTQYLCERFEKSPNITEERSVADHLSIWYSTRDTTIIPMLSAVFLDMYRFVKSWFGYRGDLSIHLWVAPTLEDLQFMTCTPCFEGYACAPGTKNGGNVILIDSPLLGGRNSDEERLSAVLAHEISHHFVTDISRSTLFAMQRKANLDVPIWLEEGLGTVIMAEVGPSLRARFAKQISETTEWYSLEDMWHDLTCCEDANRAYLQAYKESKTLVEERGKAEIVRLLYLNRTHYINWNDLPLGKEVMARARYVNDWQPQCQKAE